MGIGQLGRSIGWAFCGSICVLVAAYGVLLAINVSDEPPSADAIALERIVESKPDIPHAGNAFVYILGMAAAKGRDPVALGSERYAYLVNYTHSTDDRDEALPGRDVPYEAARSPTITALAKACKEKADAQCVRLVNANDAGVRRWIASERWLLERYLRMQTLEGWKEVIPRHVNAPSGRFKSALDGQQLLLMQAWFQAREGDAEGALAALDRDFLFWRRVLRSADSIIAKAIACSALKQNLAMGTLALRDLHVRGESVLPPASWMQPISRDERSMLRPFASEYLLHAGTFDSLKGTSGLISTNKVRDALLRPFFQVQATNNLTAADFVHATDRFDVEYGEMPAALEGAIHDESNVPDDVHAYNYFGRILHGIGGVYALKDYPLRASDLEGVRRMALLAIEVREKAPDVAEPAERLRSSAWKNPYTNAPFAWDPKAGTIVFKGLARGERGTHALLL